MAFSSDSVCWFAARKPLCVYSFYITWPLSKSFECQKCTVIIFPSLAFCKCKVFTCQQVQGGRITEAVPWTRIVRHTSGSPGSWQMLSTVWLMGISDDLTGSSCDAETQIKPTWKPVTYDTRADSLQASLFHPGSYHRWAYRRASVLKRKCSSSLYVPPAVCPRACGAVSHSQKCLIPSAPTLLSFAHSCSCAKSSWMCARYVVQYFQGLHHSPEPPKLWRADWHGYWGVPRATSQSCVKRKFTSGPRIGTVHLWFIQYIT